jgi:hypothetical protein
MGRSAKTGFVMAAGNRIAEVLDWTVEVTTKLTSYPHSDSAGWDDVVAGSGSIRGTIEVKLGTPDTADVTSNDAQDANSLMGLGMPISLVLQSAVIGYSGKAVIESSAVAVHIAKGQAISAVYRFRSKLEWTVLDGTGDDGNTL